MKQIALGAGFGFRFDLTYFIFRLDAGVRLRSPYPLPENLMDSSNIVESDYWYNWRRYSFGNIVNFNLGLGYPF
ncbi:MAG: hypothetical protein IPJ74_23295 [Saprospiraceae bacterium]|nr:hypothetical protein [Saprospiraceae bacterium]